MFLNPHMRDLAVADGVWRSPNSALAAGVRFDALLSPMILSSMIPSRRVAAHSGSLAPVPRSVLRNAIKSVNCSAVKMGRPEKAGASWRKPRVR